MRDTNIFLRAKYIILNASIFNKNNLIIKEANLSVQNKL